MNMKRREFLETTALAAGAVALGRPNLIAEEKKRSKQNRPFSTDPCAVVPLTDKISCTRIGMGTGMRGYNRESDLTRMGEEKAIALLRFAYDHDVRLFDLADLYGTHQLIATALKGKPRDSYTLVSKLWYHSGGLEGDDERPTPDVMLKRFLKECNTDYLDVLQIHCMMDGEWTERYADQMEIMEKLKQDGLIRAHGVSCHANTALEAAAKSPWTDTVHIRINHDGAKMDGSVADVLAVAEKCHEAGIGTIAMKVIGEGTFSEDPQKRKDSARFVTGLDCINAMVVGFTAEEHVTEFIANVRDALELQKEQKETANV